MERSLWRAATAGARLARARIQDWASSQQGECPGVRAALLGYAAVASACPVPLGRASAMVQGHAKIQVSMAGTASRLSLCHQVAAPVQGICHCARSGTSRSATVSRCWAQPCSSLRFMARGLPGVCRDTWSRGLVPCSHKVCAKVWPLLLQHGTELKAAQAEGLMVGSGLTS